MSMCDNSITMVGITIPEEVFEQYRNKIYKLPYYVVYSDKIYYVGYKYLNDDIYKSSNVSYNLPNLQRMEENFLSLDIQYISYGYIITQIYEPQIHLITPQVDPNIY